MGKYTPRSYTSNIFGFYKTPIGGIYNMHLNNQPCHIEMYQLVAMGFTLQLQITTDNDDDKWPKAAMLVRTVSEYDGLMMPYICVETPKNYNGSGMALSWSNLSSVSYTLTIENLNQSEVTTYGTTGSLTTLISPKLISMHSIVQDGYPRLIAVFDTFLPTNVQYIRFDVIETSSRPMFGELIAADPPPQIVLQVQHLDGRCLVLANPTETRAVAWSSSTGGVRCAYVDNMMDNHLDPPPIDFGTWSSTLGGYMELDSGTLRVYLWGKGEAWHPDWNNVKDLYLALDGLQWSDTHIFHDLLDGAISQTWLPIQNIQNPIGTTYVIVTVKCPDILRGMTGRTSLPATMTYTIAFDTFKQSVAMQNAPNIKTAYGVPMKWRIIRNVDLRKLYEEIGAVVRSDDGVVSYKESYLHTLVHRGITMYPGLDTTFEDCAWLYISQWIIRENRLLPDATYSFMIHPPTVNHSTIEYQQLSTYLLDGPMRNMCGHYVPINTNPGAPGLGSIITNAADAWLHTIDQNDQVGLVKEYIQPIQSSVPVTEDINGDGLEINYPPSNPKLLPTLQVTWDNLTDNTELLVVVQPHCPYDTGVFSDSLDRVEMVHRARKWELCALNQSPTDAMKKHAYNPSSMIHVLERTKEETADASYKDRNWWSFVWTGIAFRQIPQMIRYNHKQLLPNRTTMDITLETVVHRAFLKPGSDCVIDTGVTIDDPQYVALANVHVEKNTINMYPPAIVWRRHTLVQTKLDPTHTLMLECISDINGKTFKTKKAGRYVYRYRVGDEYGLLEIHIYHSVEIKKKIGNDGIDLQIIGFPDYILGYMPSTLKNHWCLPHSSAGRVYIPDCFWWTEHNDTVKNLFSLPNNGKTVLNSRSLTLQGKPGLTETMLSYDPVQLNPHRLDLYTVFIPPTEFKPRYTDRSTQLYPMSQLDLKVTGIEQNDDTYPPGILVIHTHVKNTKASETREVYDYLAGYLGVNVGTALEDSKFTPTFFGTDARVIMRIGQGSPERLEIYPSNTYEWYRIRNESYQLYMTVEYYKDNKWNNFLKQKIQNVNMRPSDRCLYVSMSYFNRKIWWWDAIRASYNKGDPNVEMNDVLVDIVGPLQNSRLRVGLQFKPVATGPGELKFEQDFTFRSVVTTTPDDDSPMMHEPTGEKEHINGWCAKWHIPPTISVKV
jgi:hypothetical protein